jgi:tetratricopeptide (TPR) repeat protein
MLSSANLLPLIREMLMGETARLSEGELITLCEKLRTSDPFVALGVDRRALPGEVRRRYRRLRAIIGPAAQKKQSSELRPVMEAACIGLRAAYDKLTDPDSQTRWQRHAGREREQLVAKEPEQRIAAEREQPVAEEPEQRVVEEPESVVEEQDQRFADEREPPVEGELERKREAARIAREGDEQLEQLDWLSALDSYKRAAELRPEAGQYRASLGWATYLSHGSAGLREAVDHAKAGMKLSPEHPHPPLVLGRLYQVTDRLDLAEKALKRAIRLQPDCADAVRELRILKSRSHGKGGLVSRILRRL